MQPNALKPLLQAAHAGTDRLLNAQRELVESQPVQLNTSSTPNSSGYDPAAVAAVTKVAQPLINEVIQQAGMTHMQRAVALQDAKDRTVAKLVKMGIFRNQVRMHHMCCYMFSVKHAKVGQIKHLFAHMH